MVSGFGGGQNTGSFFECCPKIYGGSDLSANARKGAVDFPGFYRRAHLSHILSVFRELCQTYREIFLTQTNADCGTDKHRNLILNKLHSVFVCAAVCVCLC